MLKRVAIGMAATALMFGSPLAAAPDGTVNYQMEQGDTLIELADDYFLSRSAVWSVVRLNRIRDPRRIAVGAKIRIPRRYLRYKPVDLRIRAVTGPVTVMSKGREENAALGRQVIEGDVISTGRKGFVSIAGYGNSRLSLPSNSRARLVDARRYLINDLVDVQVRILKGRGDVVAPKLREQERYRVGNPIAVTAVRGTQFRIGYDEGSDLGLTEVVEGNVEVAGGARVVPAQAGFGVAASSAGVRDVEELLPPPAMVAPGKIQTEANLKFTLEPVAGATGYRTQIAKDASFLEVVGEAVSQDPLAVFDSLEDGRYSVRSRAIATSGLEGKSKTFSFRRKRVGVAGTAANSELSDAFKFAWQTEGSGTSFTAFQLWEAGNRDQLLVDEIGLTESDIFVSNLANGTYNWRVATFQVDEGDVIKVWGPVQELNVAD